MIKKIKHNGGDAEFLVMILVFIVAIFIIWVLTGGPNREESKKPYVTPYNDTSASLKVYGPNDKKN